MLTVAQPIIPFPSAKLLVLQLVLNITFTLTRHLNCTNVTPQLHTSVQNCTSIVQIELHIEKASLLLRAREERFNGSGDGWTARTKDAIGRRALQGGFGQR